MKRRQTGGLSSHVQFLVTKEDDEPVSQQRRGGSYDDQWNEARAQLRRTFNMLSKLHPRMFDTNQNGLFSDIPIYDPTAPDDDDWNDDFQPAIGEEGAINSNAGGEFNFHTFLSTLIAEAPRQFDMRDRHYRTEQQTQSWDRQLPRLVDAYLRFQATGVPRDDELEDERWKILVADFDAVIPASTLFEVQRHPTKLSLNLGC
ncbi:hypothetical protein PM082_022177 [Marasmius tenuissimus]|nr:hypothetical protein PM082_022177 [Marasmius tenuissimus]